MLKSKIEQLLPKRKPDTHKGDYGRVLIVAGSPGMTGAAVLASRGALRSGAGLTYLAVPRTLVNFVDTMTPEVITLPFEKIKDIKADAVALGPGLGISNSTKKILSLLITHYSSLIIDADGLNVIAKSPQILKKAQPLDFARDKEQAQVIITPHPGEMSRLLKKSIDQVQNNRVEIAKEAAQRFNCIVVLKGNKTVVADPSGRDYINTTGNPGMATGGVGDVLTGMIASFKAQGMSSWDAATTAVYLHGLAGDLAAAAKGEFGMIATDLVEQIPYAIQKSH